MEIARFECPACAQQIETDEKTARKGVRCPNCGHGFIPDGYKPAPRPETALFVAKPEASAQWEKHLAKRSAESIRQSAQMFTIFSGVCILIGFGAFVYSFQPDAHYAAWVCGAAFGLALWLFMVAQLIHIRANTEK